MRFLQRSVRDTSEALQNSTTKKNLRELFNSFLSEQDASLIADCQAGKVAAGMEPVLNEIIQGCPAMVEQQLRLLTLSEDAFIRAQDKFIKRHAELHEIVVVFESEYLNVGTLERLAYFKQAHESMLCLLDSAAQVRLDGWGVVISTRARATWLDKCTSTLEQCSVSANARLAVLFSRQAAACRNLHMHMEGSAACRQDAYVKVLRPLKDSEDVLQQLKAEKKVLGIVSKAESALKEGTIDKRSLDPAALISAGMSFAKVTDRFEAAVRRAEQDITGFADALVEQKKRTLELRIALRAAATAVCKPSIDEQPSERKKNHVAYQDCRKIDEDQEEEDEEETLEKQPLASNSHGSVIPHSLRSDQARWPSVHKRQTPLDIDASTTSPSASHSGLSQSELDTLCCESEIDYEVGSSKRCLKSASDSGLLHKTCEDAQSALLGSTPSLGFLKLVGGPWMDFGTDFSWREGQGSRKPDHETSAAASLCFDLSDVTQVVRQSIESIMETSRFADEKERRTRIAASAKNKPVSITGSQTRASTFTKLYNDVNVN